MVFRKGYLFIISIGLLFTSLIFVSAEFSIDSATPAYINRTSNTLINFTINNTGRFNITQVAIQLPMGALFNGTNGTGASSTTFLNTSTSGVVQVIWANTTAAGFIQNTSQIKSFWFYASFADAGDSIFTVVTNDTGKLGNTSTKTLTVNFAFSGYVRNETGGLQNGTNVTIYHFVLGQNAPPTEIAVASVLTNTNGVFNFTSINASSTLFTLKMIFYNESGIATKVGTVLPAFPGMMYYPSSDDFDMSLDNSTFYLQPASTLILNATNSSTGQRFGYMVYDEKVGFPIVSNILGAVSTVRIVVPSLRSYTVMFIREFSQFTGHQACDGRFMNNTNCPTPPKSNSSLGTLSAGRIVQVTQDLTVSTMKLSGCIGVANGHNTTSLLSYNITNLIPKLEPWTGFVPPIDADSGDINLSRDISYNLTLHSECNSTHYINGIAWYNISLLGGIPYMMEFYAKNDSNEGGVGGIYLAGFVNLTTNTTGTQNQNVSLYKLVGKYWTGGLGNLNTSTMRINIQNETGGAITNSMHVDVTVKNSEAGIGTTFYMIENLVNGTFYIPLLNNSNWVKVSVYPNDGPPMQKTLNLSRNENNITLVSIEFDPGGDKGLREMNASGDLVALNSSAMPLQLRFLRRGTDEVITAMNGREFNPLKALVAGNVDLELKITATNVTMKFHNFDMFSAKQPPMFAVMDNDTLSSSTGTWQFGNFVPPEVYDNVTLIIPYDSNVNESWSYNMSISTLFQERIDQAHQLEVAWNISAGYSALNLTDEFIAYNASRYRDYLTSAGAMCSKTDATAACYMNTSGNQIIMEIPHFSGLSPSVTGAAPATTTSSSTSSGGGSSLNATSSFWTTTYVNDNKELSELGFVNKVMGTRTRIRLKINGGQHYLGVIEVSSTSATINVSSESQQAILKIGEEKKFDVTSDNVYDILVKLNEVSGSLANLTASYIKESFVPEESEGNEAGVKTGPEEAGAAGDKSGEGFAGGGKKKSVEFGTSDVVWIIIIIIILIVIGAGYYYWLWSKGHHHKL